MRITKPSVTPASARATYARVFPVPDATGVAATDTAAILAAVAAATPVGGIVDFGHGDYQLSQSLPWVSGVKYRAIEPGQTQEVTGGASYASNFLWDWDGTGTVLYGDGTFPAFSDGHTDGVGLPADVDATATKNAGIIGGIGLDGFTVGLECGAAYKIGLTYSELGRIYIKNCDQATNLVNYQELFIDAIVDRTPGGQFYGTNITPFQPGNSHFNELYHMLPGPGEGFNLNHCRGIRFDCRLGDGQNQLLIDRVQSTGYNAPLLSVTGTATASSPNITVPDGSLFLPGMLVLLPTDAVFLGWTERTLVVKSVAGNVITLAYSNTSSALNAAGSGTFNIQSRGFASVEVTAATYNTALCMLQVDVEGERVGMYVENTLGCEFHIHQVPSTSYYGLVGRNAGTTLFFSTVGLVTDFDQTTADTSTFIGVRDAIKWKPGKGQWWSTVANKYYFSGQSDGPPARIGGAATAAQLEQLLFDIGLTK